MDPISEMKINTEFKLNSADYIDNEFIIFDEISEITLSNHPIRIDAVVLTLCTKGGFTACINLRDHRVEENSLLMISPDQIVQTKEITKDFSGLFIAVSPSFIDRTFKPLKELLPFMLYIKDNSSIQLTPEEFNILAKYHSFLWDKVKTVDNIYRKEITKGILSSLFYEIYNIISRKAIVNTSHNTTRKEEIFKLFMKEVTENFKQERSVSFYASKLCLTPKHLSGVVKEVSGKTAGECIDGLVILESRALLKSTELSIQEIAEHLNFANQSFFGKYFKHFVGISPKKYRQS